MQKLISLAATACIVALLAGVAAPANAQFVTFVSGNGSDGADCLTPQTACRQIPAAISKVTAGGVVNVLPGSYGSFVFATEGKQVDIIASEGQAVIADDLQPVPGGGNTGILINVDGADAMPIRIKGFTINVGASGIAIIGGRSQVMIEDCIISAGNESSGIDMRPTGVGEASELYVTNTLISRNVGAGTGNGIRIKPGLNAAASVVLEHTRIQDGVVGMLVDGRTSSRTLSVTLRSTTIAGSNPAGLSVIDSGPGSTLILLEGSSTTNNGQQGIRADGANVTVRVSDSTIIGNNRGVQNINGAQIISHGGNVLADNIVNGTFNSTVPPQ